MEPKLRACGFLDWLEAGIDLDGGLGDEDEDDDGGGLEGL